MGAIATIKGALSSLVSAGPKGVMYSIRDRIERLQDERWERRHHVSTSEITYLEDLQIVGDNAEHGVEHDPSPVDLTRRLLDAVPARGNEALVDFGSGRGRLVLLAAERFAPVYGVEFAKELHEACLANIASYQGPLRCRPVVSLGDAADYEIPDEHDLVAWFYAPFRPPVMHKVLGNLTASYQRSPRRIAVMYCNPFHPEVVDDVGWLRRRPLTVAKGITKDRVPFLFYASEDF